MTAQFEPYSKQVWGFDPRRAGHCCLWLDASDASTVTMSGSNVTRWLDKSGSLTSGTITGAQSQNGANPTLVVYTLATNLVSTGTTGTGPIYDFVVGASVTVSGLSGGTNLNVSGGTIVGVTNNQFMVFVAGAAGQTTGGGSPTATVGSRTLSLSTGTNGGNAQTITYTCPNTFAVNDQVTITGNSTTALNITGTVLASVNSTRFSILNTVAAGTTGTGGTATTARHTNASGTPTYTTTSPSGLKSISTGGSGFFTTTNPLYTNVNQQDFSLFVAAKHGNSGVKYLVSKMSSATANPRFFISANGNTPTFEYAPTGTANDRLKHTINGSTLADGGWNIFSGYTYRPARHSLASSIIGPALISGTTNFAINGTAATELSMPLYSNVAVAGATNASGTTAVFTTSGNHGFGNGIGSGTDIINTSGFTPSAYNLTNTTITVTGLNTFTATLGSSGNTPNTVAGVAGYATPSLFDNTRPIVIGGVTSNFWNSDIGEVLMYIGTMDAITRQRIEGYLGNKWGVALPAGHIHRTIPPYLVPFRSPGIFPGVTSCITWYDAADSSTLLSALSGGSPITDNTTPIKRWNNKITGGPDITAFPPVNHVLRNTTTNAVTFNSAGGSTVSQSSSLSFSTASTFTIFSVIRLDYFNTTTAPYVSFIQTAPPVIESRLAINFVIGNSSIQFYIDGQGSTPGTTGTASYMSQNPTPADIVGDKGWVVFCHQRSGVNKQMLNTLNGNIIVLSGQIYDAGITTANFAIGGSSNVASGSRLSFGEFIVFNSALTSLERQSVEGYLMTKWGVKNTSRPLTAPTVAFGPAISPLTTPVAHPNFLGSATTIANVNGTS